MGIARMTVWTNKEEIRRSELTEAEESIFDGDYRGGYMHKSKWRNTYRFVENTAYFVVKLELLLTVLPNFEREAPLKDSAFWWGVCFNP